MPSSPISPIVFSEDEAAAVVMNGCGPSHAQQWVGGDGVDASMPWWVHGGSMGGSGGGIGWDRFDRLEL